MDKSIRILWNSPITPDKITLSGPGKVQSASINPGFASVCVTGSKLDPGPNATIVHIHAKENPFSFFLRDVCAKQPIYIPQYSAIVTNADDTRTYPEIVKAITSCGRQTAIQQFENMPEETFDSAALRARNLKCPTWLGTSRDVRIFEAGFNTTSHPNETWNYITPKFHSKGIKLPETGDADVRYNYFAGRGIGSNHDLTRGLEDDCLPILTACLKDGQVHYNTRMFVTLERSRLSNENLHGTHYLVADEFSVMATQTEAQKAEKEKLLPAFYEQDEETVLYMRIEAINTSNAPRYAWMRIPQPNVHTLPELSTMSTIYDPETGFGSFGPDRVFLVATLNGKPVPDIETAILLMPGESAEYVFKIPHRPISVNRAEAMAQLCFNQKHEECRDFWNKKFEGTAKFCLPEKRIEKMMRAAALHFDIVCFGEEPNGSVTPVVGVYSPIGTESTPIIQYLESIGMTELARRSVGYFLDKQQDSGFMQNFQSYMSETGCGIWNAAAHYFYTRDAEWLKSVRDKLVKSCDFLIDWAKKNERDELLGRGYGMIDGKVADPEDAFHSYMLNGTTYGGILLCAKALAEINDPDASRITEAAEKLRKNIVDSLSVSVATSPVAPLSDGSWCPAIGPWPEYMGPVALYAQGGTCFTHGTSGGRDGLLGPLSLVLYDVLPADHVFAEFMLAYATEHLYLDNVCYSQPYYSVHPFLHLQRGETHSFLKEFYNAVASLADRETFTFWEHYFYASPHKTHEEGWFMMRVRSMLYYEQENQINMLAGIPRVWTAAGLCFEDMRTRFGNVSLCLETEGNNVNIRVKLDSREPVRVVIRVPHPQRRKAISCDGGEYCESSETVTLSLSGEAVIKLAY